MDSKNGAARRLLILASPLVLVGYNSPQQESRRPTMPIAQAAPYVRPSVVWSPADHRAFLEALPAEQMKALQISLGILSSEDSAEFRHDPAENAHNVIRRVIQISGNGIRNLFRTGLDYHGIATWVASSADPNPNQDWNISTFKVERKLYQTLFVALLGRLNEAQRLALLEKVDPDGSKKDLIGEAAATGSAALAALSAGVAMSGFAFYTAMSTTIATVAATVGVTVPLPAMQVLPRSLGF